MNKSLIAVDVGNSFLHVARYTIDEHAASLSPQLQPWSQTITSQVLRSSTVDAAWLEQLPAASERWCVVSVNRQREQLLRSMVHDVRPQDEYQLLTYHSFPLQVDVDVPARVGTDRLAAALAAYRLRRRNGPVIVIDAGTALTVDRVDPGGVFRGGAIFPGSYLLAESLHRHTDALPLIAVPTAPPPPIGKNTEAAIASAVYWGSIGAMRELVKQMSADLDHGPEVFFTGGQQLQAIADAIGAVLVPDLVLRGVALAGVARAAQLEPDNPSS